MSGGELSECREHDGDDFGENMVAIKTRGKKKRIVGKSKTATKSRKTKATTRKRGRPKKSDWEDLEDEEEDEEEEEEEEDEESSIDYGSEE